MLNLSQPCGPESNAHRVLMAEAGAKILGISGTVILTTKKLMFVYAQGPGRKVLTIPLARIRAVSIGGFGPFKRVVLTIIGKSRELSLKITVKRPDAWVTLLKEILEVCELSRLLEDIKEDVLRASDGLSLIRWEVCILIKNLSDLVSMTSREEPRDKRKMLAKLISDKLTDVRFKMDHLTLTLKELKFFITHIAKLINAKREYLSKLMSEKDVGLPEACSSFKSIILELRTIHRSLNELRWSLRDLKRSLSWCKALVGENIMDILRSVCPHEWAGKAPDVVKCKICGLEKPCEHLWYQVAPGKEKCARCGKVRFKIYEW